MKIGDVVRYTGVRGAITHHCDLKVQYVGDGVVIVHNPAFGVAIVANSELERAHTVPKPKSLGGSYV